MAYSGKTNWVTGDKVGSADMNRIETGLTTSRQVPNVIAPGGGVFGASQAVTLDPTTEQWLVGTLGNATPLTITASNRAGGAVLRFFGQQNATGASTVTVYDGISHLNDFTISVPSVLGASFTASVVWTDANTYYISVDGGTPGGDLAGSGSTFTAPVIGDAVVTPRKLTDASRLGGAWLPTGGSPPAGTGAAICETVPGRRGVNATFTPALGTLHLWGGSGMYVPGGRTVNNICFLATVAPVTPTNWWFCIVDKATNKIVGITADQTTSTTWSITAPGRKILALATPWTPTNGTEVYIGFMQAGGTAPTLRGLSNAFGAASVADLGTPVAATALTGQTTPPAVGTDVGTLTGIVTLAYGYAAA